MRYVLCSALAAIALILTACQTCDPAVQGESRVEPVAAKPVQDKLYFYCTRTELEDVYEDVLMVSRVNRPPTRFVPGDMYTLISVVQLENGTWRLQAVTKGGPDPEREPVVRSVPVVGEIDGPANTGVTSRVISFGKMKLVSRTRTGANKSIDVYEFDRAPSAEADE